MSEGASSPGDQDASKKRILLAEDDQAVRTLAKRSLERFDYHVIEAVDGQSALTTYEAQPDGVDLLLTDIIMPQMSGRQLAKELLSRQPGLPVLYTSGFADDTVVRKDSNWPPMAFLPKPFTPMELVDAVRELLAAVERAPNSQAP